MLGNIIYYGSCKTVQPDISRSYPEDNDFDFKKYKQANGEGVTTYIKFHAFDALSMLPHWSDILSDILYLRATPLYSGYIAYFLTFFMLLPALFWAFGMFK